MGANDGLGIAAGGCRTAAKEVLSLHTRVDTL